MGKLAGAVLLSVFLHGKSFCHSYFESVPYGAKLRLFSANFVARCVAVTLNLCRSLDGFISV